MVDEGLIGKEEAIFRLDPNQVVDFFVSRLDEKDVRPEDVLTSTGLAASPGAVVGQIVFTADEAVAKAGHGAEKNPVILVRAETTPEDIHGMEVAIGISNLARRNHQSRGSCHSRHGQELRCWRRRDRGR